MNYYICSFIYNSPIWYLRRSDEKTAEKALKQFRSNNHNIQKELSELKLQLGKRFVSKSCFNCFNGNTTSRPVSAPQLRPTCGPDTQLCKPFLTLNVLFVLMLFSGKFAIEMYAVDIFKQTQDSVNENTATVILGKGVDIYYLSWPYLRLLARCGPPARLTAVSAHCEIFPKEGGSDHICRCDGSVSAGSR